MPSSELLALIAPYAPAAKTGRPPFDLATMLRIHCLQQWFGLSDLGAEEALFETGFYRDFVGISGTQRIPDRISILRFRHLLEAHDLSPKILQVINAKLAAQGLLLKTGTVVDATLIAAPSSTKNSRGERDPEMHQIKKGNQWHFGMKAHTGVDADSGLVHTVIGTAADVTQGHGLLHGQERWCLRMPVTKVRSSGHLPRGCPLVTEFFVFRATRLAFLEQPQGESFGCPEDGIR